VGGLEQEVDALEDVLRRHFLFTHLLVLAVLLLLLVLLFLLWLLS
jgi:membrane-bound metal-dependent hydrolase YbcI (DUF457 family)